MRIANVCMTSIFSCVFFLEKHMRFVGFIFAERKRAHHYLLISKLSSNGTCHPWSHPPSIALVQETSNIERTKASIPKRDITSSAVDVLFSQNNVNWALGSPPRKQPALIRDYEAHHWYWDMGYPVPLDLGDYTYLSNSTWVKQITLWWYQPS